MSKKHNIGIGNIASIGVADIDVYNTGKRKLEAIKLKNATKIKIRVGVFFDGTGNNGFNSDAIYYTKKPPLTQDDIKAEEHKGFDVETDTSYWNPYSNVKLLHDIYEEKSDNFTDREEDPHHYLQFRIYVQGIGTLQDKKDDKFGSGLGEGSRGVIARVNLACEFISDRINKEFGILKSKDKKQLYLQSLQIDVFGFSRGAAAARHFCNEVLKTKVINENLFEKEVVFKQYTPKKQDKFKNEQLLVQVENDNIPKVNKNFKTEIPIQRFAGGKLGELLQEKNINYPKRKVSIEFLGLFDTVISQILEQKGVLNISRILDALTPDYITVRPLPFIPITIPNPVNFISAIKKVNPDVSNKHIKKIFHITAGSEWRKNFPLTPIENSESRKTLKVLGAHSDIGGGYWLTEKEIKILDFFDVPYDDYHEDIDTVNEFKYKLRKWYIDQSFCNDNTEEIRWETKCHLRTTSNMMVGGFPMIEYKLVDEAVMSTANEKIIDGRNYEIFAYHFQLRSTRKLDNRLSLAHMNIMKHIAIKVGGVPLFNSKSEDSSKQLGVLKSKGYKPKEYAYHTGYDLEGYEDRMIKVADQIWGVSNGKSFDPKIFHKEKGGYFYELEKEQHDYIMKNFVHLSACFNTTIESFESFDHFDAVYANVPNMTFEDEFKNPPYEREYYTPVLAKFDKN